MLASAISQMEIGGNRRLVRQKAKRTDGRKSMAAQLCFFLGLTLLP